MLNLNQILLICLLSTSCLIIQAYEYEPLLSQNDKEEYPFFRDRYPYCHLTNDQLDKILEENPRSAVQLREISGVLFDINDYKNHLRIIVIKSGLIPNDIDIEKNIDQSFRDIHYQILVDNPRNAGESTTQWKGRIESIHKTNDEQNLEQKKYFLKNIGKAALALGLVSGICWCFKKYKKTNRTTESSIYYTHTSNHY